MTKSNTEPAELLPKTIASNSSMLNECDSQRQDFEVLVGDVTDSFSHYLKKRPMIASGLIFLAGFYVGWKIKPW